MIYGSICEDNLDVLEHIRVGSVNNEMIKGQLSHLLISVYV